MARLERDFVTSWVLAKDLPRIAAEAARRHPLVRIVCAPPLGLDEKLVDVFLERIGS